MKLIILAIAASVAAAFSSLARAVATLFASTRAAANTSALVLAAFARADKRLGGYGDDDGLQNITIFKDITSKHVRFILDGSGSMSACILWGDTKSDAQDVGGRS